MSSYVFSLLCVRLVHNSSLWVHEGGHGHALQSDLFAELNKNGLQKLLQENSVEFINLSDGRKVLTRMRVKRHGLHGSKCWVSTLNSDISPIQSIQTQRFEYLGVAC